MEMRKLKNQQTRMIMESIENMFKNKIGLLKERQANDYKDRQGAESGQKKVNLFAFSSHN